MVDPDSTLDLTAVDRILSRIEHPRQRIVEVLAAVQREYYYLPLAARRRICDQTGIRPADLESVASFYPQFRFTPAGRHTIGMARRRLAGMGSQFTRIAQFPLFQGAVSAHGRLSAIFIPAVGIVLAGFEFHGASRKKHEWKEQDGSWIECGGHVGVSIPDSSNLKGVV